MAQKKAYRKPEIKQVALAPEEAVLSGCKLGSASNAKTVICNKDAGACRNTLPGS